MLRFTTLCTGLLLLGCGDPSDRPTSAPLSSERVIDSVEHSATLTDRGQCLELSLEDSPSASWTLRSSTVLTPEEVRDGYIDADWGDRTVRLTLAAPTWLRDRSEGRYLVKGYELRDLLGDRLLGRALTIEGSPVTYLLDEAEGITGLGGLIAAVLYLGSDPRETERCRRLGAMSELGRGGCSWIDGDGALCSRPRSKKSRGFD